MLLKTIDDCFIRFFKCIHIVGASLYTLPAIGQALYFSFLITSNNLQSWEKLVFVISAVGISGGILWNILGFYSDCRLDWSKIYVDLKEFNIKSNKDLLNRKYHNFMWHALLNIIVFTLAILIAVGIVLNLHGSIIHPQDPNDINLGSISSYTFFIFLFISVITAYAKQMFMLYFVNKDQRIGVFFNIKELAQ